GVVVARNHDERLALDLVDVLPCELVLVLEPEGGQVARADNDVRLELVDLADRPIEQAGLEVLLAAMQVRDGRDPEEPCAGSHRSQCTEDVSAGRVASGSTATVLLCGRNLTGSRPIVVRSRRGSPTGSSWNAPGSSTGIGFPGSTSPPRSCSSETTKDV